ncbi:MAG: phenylalanine--tRNA ligase subunit beta, partial [Actinomycetes bacterium]
TAGWIGDLHPQISDSVGVESACVFELDLAKIAEAVPAIQHYQAVSGQPAVLQDLAVIVPRAVSSGEVVRIALESGGEVLESVELFDVYASPELGEDVVSIALRLTFRAEDRTLTEEDASAARALIVNQLNLELGATARV